MFKLSEIAPNIAARVADFEAHRAACTAEECVRCGRWPRAPEGDHQAYVQERLARAMRTIPTRFRDVRFDTEWLPKLVGAQAMQQAQASLTEPRVIFVGPPGAGKTSLAVAMFHAALVAESSDAARQSFRYVSGHALAKARAGHPLGAGEAPVVAQALAAAVLLVDELGGEDSRHASAVAEVIYERHAEDLPTWVTTGVGPQELAARYGGGIARRLFEGATVIRLTGRR